FVKRATMDTALVPQSNERKSMHNYGLGWRLFQSATDSVVYHNGKWHGSNTVFCRLVQDTATIIVLGNRLNRNIYASRRMAAIFSGKSEENVLEE
ncbi:MAG TPA: serine hydrolase, partial [Chitinophagaceae bacterium]|nr:serine hydrolase [Chitinophagaceae bacterium]